MKKNTRKLVADPVITKDVMRYRKNSLASNLTLLSLVFGCLYFMVLYAQVPYNSTYNPFNGDYYYSYAIALDVIYNLFFLLLTFYCSVQVKNYKRNLFWLHIAIGVIQIVRIFWLPLQGLLYVGSHDAAAISYSTFVWLVVFLAASGALEIAGAVIGFIRSKQVEAFKQKVENGEVDLEAAFKKEDTYVGDVASSQSENGGDNNA